MARAAPCRRATDDVVGRESPFARRLWRPRRGAAGLAGHPAGRRRPRLGRRGRWPGCMRRAARAEDAGFRRMGAVAYVGHAHIDTAWLWPIEETRRKARRTFSTAVDLIKRHPDFRFAQSFAEYYRYLEDDDPALLARGQGAGRRRAAGRPPAGLWVEPDINMPSRRVPGPPGALRPALLPAHLRRAAHAPPGCRTPSASPRPCRRSSTGAGLTSLFTIKLGWSETNRFPHTRFWWEGIDGSRVLVQQFNRPEDTYNGLVDPASLLRAWRNHTDKRWAQRGAAADRLWRRRRRADGGDDRRARGAGRLSRCCRPPASPAPEDYFDARPCRGRERAPPPTWVGELYLEYHRGVLTSQGRTKRAASPGRARPGRRRGAGRDRGALLGGAQPASLEDRWRMLMVNQFHDILPGSSITDVYVRTERELGEVVAAAGEAAAERRWPTSPARLGRRGRGRPADRQSGPERAPGAAGERRRRFPAARRRRRALCWPPTPGFRRCGALDRPAGPGELGERRGARAGEPLPARGVRRRRNPDAGVRQARRPRGAGRARQPDLGLSRPAARLRRLGRRGRLPALRRGDHRRGHRDRRGRRPARRAAHHPPGQRTRRSSSRCGCGPTRPGSTSPPASTGATGASW